MLHYNSYVCPPKRVVGSSRLNPHTQLLPMQYAIYGH